MDPAISVVPWEAGQPISWELPHRGGPENPASAPHSSSKAMVLPEKAQRPLEPGAQVPATPPLPPKLPPSQPRPCMKARESIPDEEGGCS